MNLIVDSFLRTAAMVDGLTDIEIDWTWGNGTVDSGSMSDYEWLSVSVTGADRVLRFRGRYPKGHWSSWYYVYAPEYILVPEEF